MDYDYFGTPGSVSKDAAARAPRPAAPAAPSPPPPPAPSPPEPAAAWPPPSPAPIPPAAPAAPTWPGAQQGVSAQEHAILATAAAVSYEHMTGSPSGYYPGQRLGFMGSIRVGFRLLPICWSVLTQELVLLAVPLVTMLISSLAFLGYAEAFGGVDKVFSQNGKLVIIEFFPVLALMMAVSAVGQAVIVAAASDILSGHRTPFGTAWVAALNKLPQLVGFGVVYAGERTLTGLMRGRRTWSPGSIAANAIDRAWDFATFLAVPVILYENLGVFAAVRRSGSLVVKRWGVQLTARSVLGLALFVVTLPLILIGAVVAAGVSTGLGVAIIIVALVGELALAGALTGVLSAALYRFGVTGLIAPGFSEADMWAVFDRR